MSALDLSDELEALVPGEHVHLDVVLEDPPPPGSPAWTPVLTEITQLLRRLPGHWYISFPLGDVCEADAAPAMLDDLHGHVSVVTSEPPSVHRHRGAEADCWEGQKLSQITVSEGVRTLTTLSRTWAERDQGECWVAGVTMEVVGPVTPGVRS